MTHGDVDHVIDSINAALHDHRVSDDAMRWSPDADTQPDTLSATDEAVNALRDVLEDGLTRTQLIAAGHFIAVPAELSREAGLRFPVALTWAAWEDCVRWDEADGALQDETGRLWDVLWMTRWAIRQAEPEAHAAVVRLHRVPRGHDVSEYDADDVFDDEEEIDDPALTAYLFAQIGPGDEGEPVLTICMPEEVE